MFVFGYLHLTFLIITFSYSDGKAKIVQLLAHFSLNLTYLLQITEHHV
jgi:hypothetical protein